MIKRDRFDFSRISRRNWTFSIHQGLKKNMVSCLSFVFFLCSNTYLLESIIGNFYFSQSFAKTNKILQTKKETEAKKKKKKKELKMANIKKTRC